MQHVGCGNTGVACGMHKGGTASETRSGPLMVETAQWRPAVSPESSIRTCPEVALRN